MRDHFIFRKTNQLKKTDKSLKQNWDRKITNLCELINKNENYYTTSSCSGRILMLIDSREKRDDLFIKVWHDKITFNELKQELNNIAKSKTNKLIYFKQDPCILHLACRNLEDAQKMIDLGILAGWKRSSFISSRKRFIIELNATEKIEFPIVKNKKVLVNDDFLKTIVSEANKKLKMSWEKIKRLERLIEKK